MIKKYIVPALLLLILGAAACKKNNDTPVVDPGEQTDTIPIPTGKKEAIVWIDLNANVFGTYGRFNDTPAIRKTLDTLQSVGITALVVDVKESSGHTVFQSAYTSKVASHNGKSLPANVDYLEYMVKTAKERKMKVYASVMTFVEGDQDDKVGAVYEDPTFKNKYQSIVCDATGKRVPITETGRPGFVNPAYPEVQDRIINILKEIVQKYAVDGVILDYGRYANIDADFSDYSKTQFIQYLKTTFNDQNANFMSFPTDVVSSWKTENGQTVPAVTGKYYKRWLAYRMSVIYNFVKKAHAAVKATRADALFGSYVGGWYGDYYPVGVNWASNQYDPFNDPKIRMDWAYPQTKDYGYAEELGLLMTGNYFSQLLLADNPATAGLTYNWWSLEGSLNGGRYITKGRVPLVGSIDAGNTDWKSKSDIRKAIKMIRSQTYGVMIFDLVHLYAPQYNKLQVPLWDEVKAGLE
ncbi:alpha amylase family protein [Chitinophaga arvensicola]|uniref:Glycosyl hydrolase-like 10 n=1 Tax=Chitinophaga arvensicola TaxID=29529 RepID=A0A1I0SB36_9BACT|nr:alpha amylase family protein [Chitinophaga arvensicola]SEW53875.1 Glycosyl hydrolase-like 10 [Chitinophaga arvensicola]